MLKLYTCFLATLCFIVLSFTTIDKASAQSKVVIAGTFQSELGCIQDQVPANGDWEPNCDKTALTYNAISGKWEGTFTIDPGCQEYKVAIDGSWSENYGENGVPGGPNIRLYIPVKSDVTFSYDPVSHLVVTSPYNSGVTITKITLFGDLQSELGCPADWMSGCDTSALIYNSSSGKWEGKFTLPAGCYRYLVSEFADCAGSTFYGQNGEMNGNSIPLYIPSTALVSFTYDAKTHLITSTPYSGDALQKVSLYGTLQSELGCAYDYAYDCDNPALSYNAASGKWEGSFLVPAGCFSFLVKETTACTTTSFYGENGVVWGTNIQLYVPTETLITFTYDPQTHLISSTPYSGVPQTVNKVSLLGSLQSETGCLNDYDYNCDNPALNYNSGSGMWEGKYVLPAGCYSFSVKETIGCNTVNIYGDNGVLYGSNIQLFVPQAAEITFTYDPQTHILSTSPYGAPTGVTKVSLYGSLQSEAGCYYDFEYTCDNPALSYNATSGKWEGKFTLPPGCYYYMVKETAGCDNTTLYGQNGQQWGNNMQLFVPSTAEVSFSYDAQTHIITSTPYSGIPLVSASLVGDLQTQFGCGFNWDYYTCNQPALSYNSATGLWEGTFSMQPGCYKYILKQADACGNADNYGANGNNGANEFYNYYQLYVPVKTDVTFKYNPVTHLVSCDYNGICPPNTVVIPGTFESELGCQGDWDPACDFTRLTYDAVTKLWVGTFNIPAGNWEYKVTYNNNWNENYGADGVRDGANIPLDLCVPSQVTFKYNYITHLVSLEFNPTAICINKFYDANVNGIDDDSMRVEGVQFTLSGKSNAVQYTGSDGKTTFSGLTSGNYTVTETLAPGWTFTTPYTQSLTLDKPVQLSFGNVCLGPGGGHGIGYWMNKNGEATLNDDGSMESELKMLRNLNLRNADGSDFDPATYTQLRNWLQGANAKNMAYMLSAQLVSMQLSVEAGFVKGDAFVYAPTGSPFGVDNFLSVDHLLSKANFYLDEDGYTPANDLNRSGQEFLKGVLDNANNNQTFVQPKPCVVNAITSIERIPADESKIGPSSKATVWPNPTNGYFTLRPANGSGDKIQVKVMDVNGRQVYLASGTAYRDYRFGETFSAGLYFVEIIQGTNRSTVKLIKQ